MTTEHPQQNLVREISFTSTLERATEVDATGLGVLRGEFAVFDQWTEIRSFWEGEFLERIAPGALDRTVANDLDRVKVLYDHGHDPSLGNKPLGPIRSVNLTKNAAEYEVDLIDTDYNRSFIVPAAAAGLLGSSFRFSVVGEEWAEPREATAHNPAKLPERTITDIDLYEFGPVTFPAYGGASAGMRSRSDAYLSRFFQPGRLEQFADATNGYVAAKQADDLRSFGQKATANVGSAGVKRTTRTGRQMAVEIARLKGTPHA